MSEIVPKADPLQDPSKGDVGLVAAKALIGLIPVVGGPLVEVFQHLVQPPLERRRLEWMRNVAEDIQKLRDDGVVTFEELQNNEAFISALTQASTAAVRTHQAEKLKALRNAIRHIATGQGPEETVQHLLLAFIDEFSEMHLRILAFARAPRPPNGIMGGGLNTVLENNIPVLRSQRALYDQLWKDLYLRGLVGSERLHVMMTGSGLAERQTSQLGEALLDFIADA
jgi:hypothetical protein